MISHIVIPNDHCKTEETITRQRNKHLRSVLAFLAKDNTHAHTGSRCTGGEASDQSSWGNMHSRKKTRQVKRMYANLSYSPHRFGWWTVLPQYIPEASTSVALWNDQSWNGSGTRWDTSHTRELHHQYGPPNSVAHWKEEATAHKQRNSSLQPSIEHTSKEHRGLCWLRDLLKISQTERKVYFKVYHIHFCLSLPTRH